MLLNSLGSDEPRSNEKFPGVGTALSDTKGYIGMFLNTPGMEVSFTNLKVAGLD